MKIINYYSILIVFSLAARETQQRPYDLTIIGNARFSSSIARTTIGHIDILKDVLKINFWSINSTIDSLENIAPEVQRIINNSDKTPGHVVLFDAILWSCRSLVAGKIKIAYSVIEYTRIPQVWVRNLNEHFDAVLVPDQWLIEVYKNSGVTIPIFALPHAIYIQEFLANTPKAKPSVPFVFGTSAIFSSNKNIPLLLEAFAQEFGNNPAVMLKIHSHWNYRVEEIKAKIKQLAITNIDLHVGEYAWPEYITFISSLDCYVLLSRGEGFSITPREALAAGIPTIITNTTAHKTICNTGFVKAVPAEIPVPHDGEFYKEQCGFSFTCTTEDARKALREVYNNYALYVKKAQKGREWVKQYMPHNLTARYINIVKPKNILFGPENKITSHFLMTNSKALYNKYQALRKNGQ